MYELPISSVRGWQSSGGLQRPQAVNTVCPKCSERGTFSTIMGGEDLSQTENHLKCVWMRGACPTCGFMARFVQVGQGGEDGSALFIHPSPKLIRQPIAEPDGDSVFTGKVRKAYVESVNAYNAKQWIASAVMCGRALEGITKALLPDEICKKPLAQQLKALPQHIDLSQTISDLTDGIRRGRNIAAHYDEDMEVNEPTAAKLIELLESAIEYLFVLPSRIENLDSQLKALNGTNED